MSLEKRFGSVEDNIPPNAFIAIMNEYARGTITATEALGFISSTVEKTPFVL